MYCTGDGEDASYSQWVFLSPGILEELLHFSAMILNTNCLRLRETDAVTILFLRFFFAKTYRITLVNLYGPNKDNPDFFFTEISSIIEEYESEFIIMCGDWNLVQNFGLDCYNYIKENNVQSKSEVEALKSKFNLIDPRRTHYPND